MCSISDENGCVRPRVKMAMTPRATRRLTLSNIENLTGSKFDDTLEGNAGNNVLAGGAGSDTVSYAHATSGPGGLEAFSD